MIWWVDPRGYVIEANDVNPTDKYGNKHEYFIAMKPKRLDYRFEILPGLSLDYLYSILSLAYEKITTDDPECNVLHSRIRAIIIAVTLQALKRHNYRIFRLSEEYKDRVKPLRLVTADDATLKWLSEALEYWSSTPMYRAIEPFFFSEFTREFEE